MRIKQNLFALLLILASGGCSSPDMATQKAPTSSVAAPVQEVTTVPILLSPTFEKNVQTPFVFPTPEESTPLPVIQPTQGDKPAMTPLAPGLQGLIDQALTDLVKRLSVAAADIKVLEAAEVTWPNASLGCPQEGMMYAEVLTPGYRVILEYEHRQYEYHAGKGMELIYCTNPTSPVPGAPDNT